MTDRFVLYGTPKEWLIHDRGRGGPFFPMLEEILRLANLGAELERRMSLVIANGSTFYLGGLGPAEDDLYYLLHETRLRLENPDADPAAIVKAVADTAQSPAHKEISDAL